MHILVTGGCGFIGSHLCDALVKHGHTLTIVDDLSTGKREHAPEGSNVIVEDVAKSGVFDGIIQQVDACYHLAAIASVQKGQEEWLRCHQVNNSGLVNVFAAIRTSGKNIPVVFASSAAVYGDSGTLPLQEASPVMPISAYGTDKLACELAGRVAFLNHGISNIGLRFFNVFGPRQDPASPYSGVVSIFARKALAGEPLVIYGDGKQSRDFVYVADVVRCLQSAMAALLESEGGYDVFNVCSGAETTVGQLATSLIKQTGKKSGIEHQPARSGDIRHSRGSTTKAQEILAFSAGVPFEDGLQHTLNWLRDNA